MALVSDLITPFVLHYWLTAACWTKTQWFGQPVYKAPTDLWMYQEIIAESIPDLLIETGTSAGGSALFFASLFDLIGRGHVLTIDTDNYEHKQRVHPRITFLIGDSLTAPILEVVYGMAIEKRCMVSLDSLHTYEQVRGELEAYAWLTGPGCYCVVEDTMVDYEWGRPAAGAAVNAFLANNPGMFDQDRTREQHLLTLNPGGWLRRL